MSLGDMIIDYIENNKVKYKIDYKDSINTLKYVIKEIEKDYEKLEESE